MKHLITLFALFVSLSVFSQTTQKNDNKVNNDNASKSTVYGVWRNKIGSVRYIFSNFEGDLLNLNANSFYITGYCTSKQLGLVPFFVRYSASKDILELNIGSVYHDIKNVSKNKSYRIIIDSKTRTVSVVYRTTNRYFENFGVITASR